MRCCKGGGLLQKPLGVLAGTFMGYELSVRGRQYESIASELNTDLFGDGAVKRVVQDTLGFTLGDVRAVRNASADLLNQRFFGARDRVGDIAQAGSDPGEVGLDAFRHDINLMLNECRLFGAVCASDVASADPVDETVVRAVLEFFSSFRPVAGETNPVVRFARGERLCPLGSIADGGDYLILNGFLGEDELRRDIERGLVLGAQRGGGAPAGPGPRTTVAAPCSPSPSQRLPSARCSPIPSRDGQVKNTSVLARLTR